MILIALGSNIPGPLGEWPAVMLRGAVESLRTLPGLQLTRVSPWYRSAPIPPSGQPDYLNGVARLDGAADPAWLLRRLQAIEAAAGRVRTLRNAARPLDLDIIAMDGIVRAAPDPILPHPRAHERAFVLLPLADVAPGWLHPVLGATAADLAARLGPQAITRET